MDEVCKNEGNIVFPPYEENNNITGADQRHEIGSFPNRFQANVPMILSQVVVKKGERYLGKDCRLYLGKIHIGSCTLGKGTKEIWDRQVEGFWYMQWC